MNPILIGLFIYLVIVLTVGTSALRQNRSHADYLIADRKLGSFAIALSERASGESAWLIIGLPGAAYAAGFLEIWAVIGCLAGIIFSWLALAKPIRELAGRYDALTLPDLISSFFNDTSGIIRLVASLIITFFFTLYIAAQFNAAGKVLNVTFGLPHSSGMLVSAGVIVLYTMLGGFRAVVWTDVVQAIIMIASLIILPLAALFCLSRTTTELPAIATNWFSVTSGKTGWTGLLVVMSGLSWGLGYTGQPHLIARYIAIRDTAAIRRGKIIAICWALPAFWGAFFLGIFGMYLFGAGHFSDPERLMPTLATLLLPGWLAGFLISGAIAAMMSTADSQLIVSTSALTEDIFHKTMRREVTTRRMLSINRIATVLVGALAFGLACSSTELVFALVSYAWSGLGASFGPVLLAMIYWPGITRQGALAGLISGALGTIVWKNISYLNAIVSERLAAFLLAALAIITISLITRPTRTGQIRQTP